MLRRSFAALMGLLVLLLGAIPASAAQTLVIYPFAVTGTVPADLGTQLSDKIAADMRALGGIQVVRGAATVKPADYRASARAAGADFYFTGSITLVFNRYSAIEQVVSTRTGTVVWSVPLQFSTLADLSGEGARIRTEMMRGEPTPAPGVAADGASLVTPTPMSGFAILPVTGSATDADRTYAVKAIVDTLRQRGFNVVTVTRPTSGAIDPSVDGVEACTQTKARTLIAGALDTTRVATGASPQTTAHIALRTYDCRVHVLDSQATVVNHIAPVAEDAIRGAIQDAVSAFPAPS
jgi:TolB-like protein